MACLAAWFMPGVARHTRNRSCRSRLFGRLRRHGFLSHLRSLTGYDEPETLRSQNPSNCLAVADGEHLLKGGHEVTVIERQPGAGLETSFANGGIVCPSLAELWATPGAFLEMLRSLGHEDAPLLLRLRAVPHIGTGIFSSYSTARPHGFAATPNAICASALTVWRRSARFAPKPRLPMTRRPGEASRSFRTPRRSTTRYTLSRRCAATGLTSGRWTGRPASRPSRL